MSNKTEHIYKLADLSDPIYKSTHPGGYVHALNASIQGLRDLDQQIMRQRIQHQNQKTYTLIAIPTNLHRVFVPVEARR